MLIDAQNTFDWEAALTADRKSTNVIDLLSVSGALNAGATGGPSANTIRDIGAGEPLYLHIVVATDLTDADGTPTLDVSLISDSVAALTTSPTTHWAVTGLTEAALVAGYWIAKGIALPAGNYERYLGIQWTTQTADFDGGTVSAWISNNRFDDRTYESGQVTGVN